MRPRFLIALFALVACVPAHAEKVVLGKLGEAIKTCPIYARPSTRAHVYYRAKATDYLVIQPETKNGFYKVLLQNGSYGYAAAAQVARLPYEVTADRSTTPTRQMLALSSRSRAQVAGYSLEFKGVPYKWGGNDPSTGIDCSGFVKYLYGKIGVSLPRTAAEQVYVGQRVARLEDLKPGDRLYFWSYKRNKIGHTGIYLGNGYFCHSSTNHGGVDTDYLGTKKWLGILVAARR